jgi:serine/threonine-protein kinase
MAVIHRAWDEILEREVAVKLLHEHLADDEEIRRRFASEARHAAALSHPHIVAVFDQGVGPPPFIVMELVDGPSLRDVLIERKRLTPRETAGMLLPVCEALARAHAAGLVHRDVKPENVLVTPEGKPKVADFGIAHAMAGTRHTTAGSLIGSVHYIAPELVLGRTATPATDQYAVGVLAFELLTGRKPLPADTPSAVLARISKESIPRPGKFARDVPRALDKVVAKASALDPGSRYPDMQALAAALRSAVPRGSEELQQTERLRTKRLETRRLAAAPAPVAKGRRPRGGSVVVLTALLLLALAVGLVRSAAPQRRVPDLTGLRRDGAASVMRSADLQLAEAPAEPSRDVPEGSVLSQEPAPGSRLERGDTVTVVLSSGPAVLPMPRLLQLSEQQATERLAASGLEFTRGESYSDVAPRGEIIAQLPDAGVPVREGDEVRIHVSMGKEPVEVPDVEGDSRDDAERRLAEAGLTPAFVEEYSDDVPDEGDVIRQSIGAGTVVDKGSAIEVVVSKGPETFRVPNVRGLPVDEARQVLEAEGLVVSITEQPRPRFGPIGFGSLGLVADTSPRPGRVIRRGETVVLVVFVDASSV